MCSAAGCASCLVWRAYARAKGARVVGLIRLSGHTVGHIGDGVNDVPALTAADTGIVVDSAAAESKKVADLVLLKRDLGVVAEGVCEDRASFAKISCMGLPAPLCQNKHSNDLQM